MTVFIYALKDKTADSVLTCATISELPSDIWISIVYVRLNFYARARPSQRALSFCNTRAKDTTTCIKPGAL